ncbi:hypothetical protein QX51_12030 [Terrisporobacter othiniensis]|uniref:PD-(D/E)XK nuclease domain-containing protein n=1 Tax=Terrisporobacter othiniensis TaxID=1577792 RepID=A0A0B3WQE9_9FIRM|nr:PD-(D/E)XK nuclease superfamily protein [Terrisporobacter othiniensis]KHS56705.1 hypothetical protein QX51_12030 [Terrisporobacter othiniensis]
MSRKPNTVGGGAQTNKNGLHFERTTSLNDALINQGYKISNYKITKDGQYIGMSMDKHKLYSEFLNPRGVDYTKIISRKLLPDEALYNDSNKTLYIIEKKFQQGNGSVDEKLQTCDFKKKQYKKLVLSLNLKVEYIYVLCDWFAQAKYRDVFDYIKDSGCHYYFNEIPLSLLGI